MNESIMYKDGINILVEEANIENEIDSNFDKAKEYAFHRAENTVEDDKATIIELRNDCALRQLTNPEKFIGKQMEKFGQAILAKKLCLCCAKGIVFRMSHVLEKDITMNDLFKKVSFFKDEEKNKISIKYEAINMDLIEAYKKKLEHIVTMVKDCLYNNLYDKSIIDKYLPLIYFLSDNIL